MRSNNRTLAFAIALLATSTACDRDDADSGIAEIQTDSGAIASAAAEAIVATLRGTTLADTAAQRRWLLAPGPSSWDTLLADELRRAEPSIADEAEDTTLVTTVSTHGFATRGDTVDVTVVVRSCVRADTAFNFTKDSLVHRLVRTNDEGESEWRQAGSVTHDHAVGDCEPTAAPESDPPNG
jgi:hypothetical protein